ncbi:MAG: helix-turn-helix domain-containing protein [Candidatus Aenigmatarchaeota archaeon]
MDMKAENYLYKEESDSLEYKENFNTDDVAEAIAAFSTNKGGIILIGVKDDGTPCGFRPTVKFEENIRNICNSIQDSRAHVNEILLSDFTKDRKIGLIHVLEGHKKPYGWKGAYFGREGKSTKKLDGSTISKLRLSSLNLTFDALPCVVYGREAVISDISDGRLRKFIKDQSEGVRKKAMDFVSPKQVLQNLDLLARNNHQPKNAAVLMFGEQP